MYVEGDWDWGKTSFELTEDLKLEIIATAFSENPNQEAKIRWIYSNKGNFQLKSGYKQACFEEKDSCDNSNKHNWDLRTPTYPKILELYLVDVSRSNT